MTIYGMETKFCTYCAKTKEIGEFSPNKSRTDGLQNYCKSCRSEYQKKWYEKNHQIQSVRVEKNRKRNIEKFQQFIIEYLTNHSCVDCGNDNILCLDFDHRENKLYNVSVMREFSLEIVKKEIAKCDIRCANCHRIKTAYENGNYKIMRGGG